MPYYHSSAHMVVLSGDGGTTLIASFRYQPARDPVPSYTVAGLAVADFINIMTSPDDTL